jgi:heterodisulfide reductase subunit A
MPTGQPRQEDSSPRIGVYVCRCGGNISDVVDVERVTEAAGKLPGVVLSRQNTFMCSDPGQQMILDDIRSEGLNRVVVAACSPSLHEMTFRHTLTRSGLNPYLFEHTNIREQVSWVSKKDPGGATEKAIRLVAASVAKSRLSQPLTPVRVPGRREMAVIGAGVAGLRCARDLSQRGFSVVILERSAEPGGRVGQLHRLYPRGRSAEELLSQLLAEVASDRNIRVFTRTRVTGVSGYVGNFILEAEHEGLPLTVEAGAIVVATGFQTYEPAVGEYGFRQFDEVITLPQLQTLLRRGNPSMDGGESKNVCLIHCVGSRQIEGIHTPGPDGVLHEYCSRFCCTAAIETANEIRERFPRANVFHFYRDIRTYGREHEGYYEEAGSRGVRFLRFLPEQPPEVFRSERRNGSPLAVKVKDTLTGGEEIEVPADLVVLVTGAVPRDVSDLASMLKISHSADGFLQEVHPKLRPVETAVNGVFLAGGCQAPMDIGESVAAASAAAARVTATLRTGEIAMDPFVAMVDPDRCQGEAACVEECRFQRAITLEEEIRDGVSIRRARVNPALCNGCGMCVPACPHGAIQVQGCRLDQIEAMVDAIVAEV